MIGDRFGKDLIEATFKGDVNAVRDLVRSGGSVNVADKNNRTLVMIAVEQNNISVLEFLVEREADLNTICNNGNTALDIVFKMQRRDILSILRMAGARRSGTG